MSEQEPEETGTTRQLGESTTAMVTALVRMRGALQETRLPLELPGADEQRTSRAEMVDQLEDYVIPRLMTLDAPLLAVVGGSTGAGKSTLVNSLVGTRVTTPGVLRPTTRSGSARRACCRTSSGSAARPTTPRRSSWWRRPR